MAILYKACGELSSTPIDYEEWFSQDRPELRQELPASPPVNVHPWVFLGQLVSSVGSPNMLGPKIPIPTRLNVQQWEAESSGSLEDKFSVEMVKYGCTWAMKDLFLPQHLLAIIPQRKLK